MPALDWGQYPNFSEHELACRCCGRAHMDPEFMAMLQALRRSLSRPVRISSGYRCPAYNARVSSTGENGPHTTGCAVDIGCAGRDAFDILRLAIALGFTGIGVSQKGSHGARFIHIDTLPPADGVPRPWVWSYP